MIFQKGQKIEAKFIELLSDNEWIVSFQGNLYRVKNESEHKIEANQVVDLIISSKDPLILSINLPKKHKTDKIDLTV